MIINPITKSVEYSPFNSTPPVATLAAPILKIVKTLNPIILTFRFFIIINAISLIANLLTISKTDII